VLASDSFPVEIFGFEFMKILRSHRPIPALGTIALASDKIHHSRILIDNQISVDDFCRDLPWEFLPKVPQNALAKIRL
jgi:hypothetical protein